MRTIITAPCLIALVALALAACTADTPAQLIAKADAALAAGDAREAVIQLRNALEQEPKNTEALVRLGDIYLFVGDPQTSERYYRSAHLAGAAPERYQRQWLQSLLGAGRYEEALERSNDLLVTDPRAYAARGYAQQGLRQLQEAERSFRAGVEATPTIPDAHTDLAQLLLQIDRPEDADREIAAALALQGDHPAALTLLGGRQFAAGDTPGALRSLTTATESAAAANAIPVWVTAMAGQAEIQLYLGDEAAAEQTIDKLGQTVGERIPVRYLRAEMAVQKNELVQAKDLLQEILGEDERHAPSQRLLGSIYALENRLNLAELYLKMAVNSDARDRIARGLLAAVRIRQDNPEAALTLLGDADELADSESGAGFLALAGQASLQAGNVDRALEYFGTGAEAFPGDWRFALGQALAYLNANRTDEAVLLLESLDDQGNPEVSGTARVISYVQSGARDKAAAEAERLAAAFKEQAWSQNLLGAWRLQEENFAGAARAFSEGYALEPNPDSAAGAAEARLRGGLPDPDEWLKDWLVRNPDDLPTLHALGQMALAMGRLDAAGAYYEQVVDQDPRHAGALNNLAWIYQDRGDERAIDYGRQAYAVARNNPAIVDTLGWALVRFDAIAEGRRVLMEASALAPADPEIRYHLAVAMVRDGDTTDGRQLLTALLASGQEFPSREDAQKMLARL